MTAGRERHDGSAGAREVQRHVATDAHEDVPADATEGAMLQTFTRTGPAAHQRPTRRPAEPVVVSRLPAPDIPTSSPPMSVVQRETTHPGPTASSPTSSHQSALTSAPVSSKPTATEPTLVVAGAATSPAAGPQTAQRLVSAPLLSDRTPPTGSATVASRQRAIHSAAEPRESTAGPGDEARIAGPSVQRSTLDDAPPIARNMSPRPSTTVEASGQATSGPSSSRQPLTVARQAVNQAPSVSTSSVGTSRDSVVAAPPAPPGAQSPDAVVASPAPVSTSTTTTTVVQRDAEPAAASAPEVVSPALGAASAAAPATSAAPVPATIDLEELTRRLFEPLTARLKTELRLDRERAGVITDLRR